MALFSRIIAINSSGQKLILARLKKMDHSRKIGATRQISQEFCLQIQPARGAEEARSASESNSSRRTNMWGSTRAATDSLLDKVDKDKEESNKASEVFRERFNNIDAINAALRKIKYRGDQKLSQYLITEDDIGKISTLNKFLTKLDIFSTTLGGDKFVTSSIVFPVMAAMKKLLKPDNSDPVYIAKLKEVILEDFVKRANSNIDGNFLLLATALDPRWKDLKVITKESRERAFGRLKKEMMSLQPSTSSGTEQEQQSKPKRRLLDFDASDESIEEEDELDAELSRLLIDKLSICNL